MVFKKPYSLKSFKFLFLQCPQEKHSVSARRTWLKLHLAIDEKYQILACELTTSEMGNTAVVPDWLTQIPMPFKTFIGDGVYDGELVLQAILDRESDATMVIPPHKTAEYTLAVDIQSDDISEPLRRRGALPQQKTKAWISASALNRMTNLGIPVFLKI